jgi:hypothetical protein
MAALIGRANANRPKAATQLVGLIRIIGEHPISPLFRKQTHPRPDDRNAI